jgi:hypothetical protein
MFNPDAEVFVIFYPHGSGGRFLYSVMCLDPSIVSPAGENATFDEVKEYLSSNENAHANNSHHLNEYVSARMPHADRYDFCIHQNEYGPAVPLLQRCKNLKIIIITIDSFAGMYLLDKRRSFLGRNIRDEIAKLTYCVKPGEIERLAKFGSLIEKQTNTVPGLIVDIKDYWNPDIAVSLLNKYFSEHNINCKNWEELYHIWLANSITVCLK